MKKQLNDLFVERKQRLDALLLECKVFFAFSDEQFENSKTALDDGDQYAQVGMGTYMPKSLVKRFVIVSNENKKWADEFVKENGLEEAEILNCLDDHEAFYTCELDDTAGALPQYTIEQIQAVFDKHKARRWESEG